MSELQKPEKIYGCQSLSCYIKKPIGQGTNGPCMCPKSKMKAYHEQEKKVLERDISMYNNTLRDASRTIDEQGKRIRALEDNTRINHSIEIFGSLIECFNKFIQKWCGKHSAHLLDSDENDGETIRDNIKTLEDRFKDAEELNNYDTKTIWKLKDELANLEKQLKLSVEILDKQEKDSYEYEQKLRDKNKVFEEEIANEKFIHGLLKVAAKGFKKDEKAMMELLKELYRQGYPGEMKFFEADFKRYVDKGLSDYKGD